MCAPDVSGAATKNPVSVVKGTQHPMKNAKAAVFQLLKMLVAFACVLGLFFPLGDSVGLAVYVRATGAGLNRNSLFRLSL